MVLIVGHKRGYAFLKKHCLKMKVIGSLYRFINAYVSNCILKFNDSINLLQLEWQ